MSLFPYFAGDRLAPVSDDGGRHYLVGWHVGGTEAEIAAAFADAGVATVSLDGLLAPDREPFGGVPSHDRLALLLQHSERGDASLAYVVTGDGEVPEAPSRKGIFSLLLLLEDIDLPPAGRTRLEAVLRSAARAQVGGGDDAATDQSGLS